jgi:hypothetical protein
MEIRKEFMGKVRTDYMVGVEVEKTPAFSLITLFVQGYKSTNEIISICKERHIHHVYLGANRSYNDLHDWNSLIIVLLEAKLLVTLDYPISYHKDLTISLSSDIWSNGSFIPMATIDMANINLSKNLIVKFDEPNLTNDGVWCVHVDTITSKYNFTSWDEYKNDESI